MALTNQQIIDYASKKKSEGASDSEIKQFISLAKAQQTNNETTVSPISSKPSTAIFGLSDVPKQKNANFLDTAMQTGGGLVDVGVKGINKLFQLWEGAWENPVVEVLGGPMTQLPKVVGGAVGVLGGAIGGVLGGIEETAFQTGKAISGGGFDVGEVGRQVVQSGKDTASFGFGIGEEGTKITPLTALGAVPTAILAGAGTYEGAKDITQGNPIEGLTQIGLSLLGAKSITGMKGKWLEPEIVGAIKEFSTLGKESSVFNALQQQEINNTANVFREVAGMTKPMRKIASQSARAGKDPAQRLAEWKANETITVEGGKINTIDSEGNPKFDFNEKAQPLYDVMEDYLTTIQPSVSKIRLLDLKNLAIEKTRTPQTLGSAIAGDLEKEIIKDFEFYADKKNGFVDQFGEMNLKKIFEIRRAKNQVVKWDLLNPNKKTADEAIANAAKEIVENTIPNENAKGIVKELNNAIGDILNAKKYYLALDGRVVKGGNLAKYFGRMAGIGIGSAVPIPGGEIVGYFAGDVVVDILQSNTFSNPLKQIILSNFKKTKPEIYNRTIKYLVDAKKNNLIKSQTGLSIIPKGQAGNPIITPAPTTFEPRAKVVGDELLLSQKGLSGLLTKDIFNITEEIKKGGITYNIPKAKNMAGEPYFAVSVHPNRASIPKKVEDFTAEDLRTFLIDNSDLLIREDRNLGGWIDNGEVYLDVSKLFKNKEKAILAGQKFDQMKITDLSKILNDFDNAFIDTGGTGKKMDITDNVVELWLKEIGE